MVPPDRVGQLWTPEIAASRITARLDLGDLHLVTISTEDLCLTQCCGVGLGVSLLGSIAGD